VAIEARPSRQTAFAPFTPAVTTRPGGRLALRVFFGFFAFKP
jgi:hypothetical protein